MKNIFSTKWGIIITGVLIGVIAIVLQYLGNPPNMGFCIACFERDIAGAIGLHNAEIVKYIRPEIVGIMLGSMIISLFTKEFHAKGGSSGIIRFFLGIFAMLGALVFLGCPWRTLLRLAGGDLNAFLGLAGLITGIGIGVIFLRNGFSLGRAKPLENKISGFIMPLFMLVLLLMLVFGFSKITLSKVGPGSMHAPLIISIIAGLLVGMLAQRSRFCIMGAFRDIFIIKDFHLFLGILSLLITAFILNLILGTFHAGFEAQPIAHSLHIWNFLGMVLAGLAFALAGGCPGRQLILTGEGNTDSGLFVIGMITGAAFAHNFGTASSPKGTGPYGEIATIIGIVFCVAIGFLMTKNIKKKEHKL